MIVYKMNQNGQATNLRFVSDDWILTDSEISLEGDILPDIETLHTDAYKASVVEKKVISEAKIWLDNNDWKYNQHTRRTKRGTITPAQESEFNTFLEEAHEKAQLVPKEV